MYAEMNVSYATDNMDNLDYTYVLFWRNIS